MYRKWEAMAQDSENKIHLNKGIILPPNENGWEWQIPHKASVEENYIPTPRKPSSGSSGSGGGSDMP